MGIGQWGAFEIIDINGARLPAGTLIRVTVPPAAAPGGTLATLYTDLTGTVQGPNPVPLDTYSNLTFFATDGTQYGIQAVEATGTAPLEKVFLPPSGGSGGTGSVTSVLAGTAVTVTTPTTTPTVGVILGTTPGTAAPGNDARFTLSTPGITAAVAGTYTIPSPSGTYHLTATGATTIAAPTAKPQGGVIWIALDQDGTGGRAIAFTGVTYATGSAPTWPTAPNARSLVRLVCYDGAAWTLIVDALGPGTGGGGGGGGGTRADVTQWPFPPDDAFNMPLGAGATFGTGVNTVSGFINCNNGYSVPLFVALASDPSTQFIGGTGYGISSPLTIPHCPTGAQPDTGGDHEMAIIQPFASGPHRIEFEQWGLSNRDGSGHYTIDPSDGINTAYDLYQYSNIGVNGAGGANGINHGARAASISAIAGLIRIAEMNAGLIPHALCMLVAGDDLSNAGPHWPATSKDGFTYSPGGNLPMGSRLAIPRSVNLAAQGFSTDGLVIATALQKYGAILVDFGGGGGTLFVAEKGMTNPIANGTPAELNTMVGLLQLVTNASTSQSGLTGLYNTGQGEGGGAPVASYAPALGNP